jgi:hypothetical protein
MARNRCILHIPMDWMNACFLWSWSFPVEGSRDAIPCRFPLSAISVWCSRLWSGTEQFKVSFVWIFWKCVTCLKLVACNMIKEVKWECSMSKEHSASSLLIV